MNISTITLVWIATACVVGCGLGPEGRPTDMMAVPQCERQVNEVGLKVEKLKLNISTSDGLVDAATDIQNVRADVNYLYGKCSLVEAQRLKLARYREELDALENKVLWGH